MEFTDKEEENYKQIAKEIKEYTRTDNIIMNDPNFINAVLFQLAKLRTRVNELENRKYSCNCGPAK